MREELVKVVYKKFKLGIREKLARIAACCCKDVDILIAEAEDEISKEKEIKKRLRTGMSLDLDKKLGQEEEMKLEALQAFKPKDGIKREAKKKTSKIWTHEFIEEDSQSSNSDDKILTGRFENLQNYKTNEKPTALGKSEDSGKICRNTLYILIYSKLSESQNGGRI